MTPKDPPSFENQERTHSSPLSEDLAERPPHPFSTDYMNAHPASKPLDTEISGGKESETPLS